MYNAPMYIRIYYKYKLYICACVYRLADYFAAFVINFVIDVRCTCTPLLKYDYLSLTVVIRSFKIVESGRIQNFFCS